MMIRLTQFQELLRPFNVLTASQTVPRTLLQIKCLFPQAFALILRRGEWRDCVFPDGFLNISILSRLKQSQANSSHVFSVDQ